MVNKDLILRKILFTLRVNRKYILRVILYTIIISWIGWNYLGVRNFVYKRLYGRPTKQVLTVWDKEQITDVKDANSVANFNGYKVIKSFKKKYAVSGMLVYHDDNTTFWKKYFWNPGGEKGEIYNQIASHDLTIMWGKTAYAGNLKNLKVTHGLNYVDSYECKTDDCHVELGENNNFHVIPANKRLDRALSILPQEENVPIYVEGYLTFWYGTGDYKDLKFESALDSQTISKQKIGGLQSSLCYQLYLTRFIYDGYEFK